jgi:hypothetical protein
VYALLCALAVFCPADRGHGAESASDIAYAMSFSDYSGGPALAWLAKKGFAPKRDAANESKVVFSSADQSLVLQTRKQAAGLLLNEANVLNYSKIRIDWGVDAFPPGASYGKGIRSEAVMIFVFFGDKKLSRGPLLIPGGRYVCIDRATVGQSMVSDYPIAAAFTRLFGKSEAPDISGLGISIDTESARGNGVAKSFIRKIEFIK